YYNSFLKTTNNIRLGIARAGNVIGGGDWAKDRIVVDCIKAWTNNNHAIIRNPLATRPWQHVLEPLSGYLCLGQALATSEELNGDAFNFGPKANQNHTVEELITSLSSYWEFTNLSKTYEVESNSNFYEANLLKLNCDKALSYLKWQAVLDYEQTTRFTGEWYYDNYLEKNVMDKTISQISEYCKIASENKLPWTE
ncbi:CDP-glucose 4,6-dehydratase, partial [Verrucomicrobia bacterium]|nr:CDP-glucose 4,6-dehydratase [Verrucomicrobiota bacterium]